MPQLSQQSSPPLTTTTTTPMTNAKMMMTTTTINGPTNRTRSPIYLDIENSRSMMNNVDETVGTSPNHNNDDNGRTTMVQFDNFVVDDVDGDVDDVVDDEDKIIRSAKGQLIDFNLFYENLLANHHHHQAHHHHRHHHHHHDLYALNSATFFNESLNYCLNKVCNGKHHHQHNHHQNGLANNETINNNIGNNNHNNNNNNNNKSFSIDSILGFAAAAAVARQDIGNKDPINDGDVVLYGHQPKLLHSMHGNQSVLYHHHQQQQHQATTISAKKLSNEAHHHHHHHHLHNNHCLKQNDQKLKGNSNGNGNGNNKKIGASKKCMKAIGNVNDDVKNFVGHNVGHPNNKSKRIRTIFTPEQLERLEIEFEKQQYMVGTGRLYLASTLNLTEAQVKVWFQNRRIKWRKQHLEGYQDTTAVATIIKDQQKMMADDVVDDHAKPIMAT